MRGGDFLQTHPEGGLYRKASRKDGSPHCSMKERNTVWHTIRLMVYRLLATIAIMAKTIPTPCNKSTNSENFISNGKNI